MKRQALAKPNNGIRYNMDNCLKFNLEDQASKDFMQVVREFESTFDTECTKIGYNSDGYFAYFIDEQGEQGGLEYLFGRIKGCVPYYSNMGWITADSIQELESEAKITYEEFIKDLV
jgi:hypothetical protein